MKQKIKTLLSHYQPMQIFQQQNKKGLVTINARFRQQVRLWGLMSLLLTIFISDLLATKYSLVGRVGVFAWYASFFCLIVIALKNIWILILTSLKNKSFFTLAGLLILISLIVINLTKPQNISGETTQEVNCALSYFQTKDWGYHDSCFLGYPVRQYLIPALPSLIWGRNQLTLNLGGSLYFLTAVIIFSQSLLEYFRFSQKNDLITAIILTSLLHFHYLNHFLFHLFEQSNFPLSLSLLTIGLLFKFLKQKKPRWLVLIGISFQYLVFSYTPSLAFLGLGLVGLGYLLTKHQNKLNKFISLSIIVITLMSLCLSLSFRRDIRLLGNDNNTPITFIQNLNQIGQHLLFSNQGQSFYSPIIVFPLLITVLIPLTLVLGWQAACIAGWVCLTVIVATQAKGYSFYSLDFRIHRALVVAPTVLTLLHLLLQKINLQKKLSRSFLIVTLLLLTLSGLKYQTDYIKNRPISQHLAFSLWLKQQLPDFQTQQKLYFINPKTKFISLRDELQYFFPQLILTNKTIAPSQTNCTSSQPGLYLVHSSHVCYDILSQPDEKKEVIAYYTDFQGQQLLLLQQN
ncbi:MAG: hypothetical protein GF390_00755 [Candidatus Pacebacteria bacterium]|nr:hypothetical protein [Candidatus Paceibacterota bacterium]